ncbi:hypothetical protein HY638_02530 [Candidatus Woesearchaeota archaeon]|nr:hypothetical protein [Candidatus Woesearchaeota archaeon]
MEEDEGCGVESNLFFLFKMSTLFAPIDCFEKSPKFIGGNEGVQTSERVELCGLPLGTVIQFHGAHPDSKYLCLIAGTESHKQIKIWLKGRGNGAIGDLDAIVSRDLGAAQSIPETGVMQIGRNYFMPTFSYDSEGNLTLEYHNVRTEPYSKIFVMMPR